jgi:squalene cyclase
MNGKTEEKILQSILKQNLDEDIIKKLAEKTNMDIREAMDIYYKSNLAKQIAEGAYGIQYLDANYLIEDMIENELGKNKTSR